MSDAHSSTTDTPGKQPDPLAPAPLEGRLALKGYSRDIGDIVLQEAPQTALVSLAFADADRQALADALAESCDLPWPSIGDSSLATNKPAKEPGMRLIALQQDQYWLCWHSERPAADRQVRSWLGDSRALLADQSDGWAHLTLSGAGCIAILERLCPLDMHDRQFPVNGSARTVMEHLSVIIVREGEQRFGLFTPRSSASSFAHTLENVALHVKNEAAL